MTLNDRSIVDDIRSSFEADNLDFIGEVYVWEYSYENYTGSAYLLYRDKRDGLLYEVHGSHCSCYGLEDQFAPEKVSTKRLQLWLDTLKKDDFGWRRSEFDVEMKQHLERVLPTLEEQSGQ